MVAINEMLDTSKVEPVCTLIALHMHLTGVICLLIIQSFKMSTAIAERSFPPHLNQISIQTSHKPTVLQLLHRIQRAQALLVQLPARNTTQQILSRCAMHQVLSLSIFNVVAGTEFADIMANERLLI